MKYLLLLLLTSCAQKPTFTEIQSFCDKYTGNRIDRASADAVKTKWAVQEYGEFNFALGEYDGCLFGIEAWENRKAEEGIK